MRGFVENARELGVRSPIFDSLGAIAQIRAQLFRIDLDDPGGFPFIENPLDTAIIPDLVSAVTNQLAPLNTTGTAGTAGFVGANNLTSMPSDEVGADGLTNVQRTIVGNDPLYAGIARKSNLSKQKPTILGQT